MIGGESETVLLTGNAFINGEVGSMIGNKFSNVVSLKSALFSLVFGRVGKAVDVFSIDGAFTFSRLFRLASVSLNGSQGSGGGRLGKSICVGLQRLQFAAICHLK